jgi:hypothetical protein
MVVAEHNARGPQVDCVAEYLSGLGNQTVHGSHRYMVNVLHMLRPGEPNHKQVFLITVERLHCGNQAPHELVHLFGAIHNYLLSFHWFNYHIHFEPMSPSLNLFNEAKLRLAQVQKMEQKLLSKLCTVRLFLSEHFLLTFTFSTRRHVLTSVQKPEGMITDIKKFTTTFNKIAHNKSEEVVFTDYLDMVICALSGGKYEEEYLAIVKRYKREDIDMFCELMAEMLIVMDNGGLGLADCLGEFYQTNLSRGKNGQFFTPEHVCAAMSAMLNNKEDRNKTILDPCCGSGRMLLSAAKVSRHNHFFGADVDHRCVKMTVINLCLNGLRGEVAWMNSLSLEHWGGYVVYYDNTRMYVPTIRKLSAKEGYIYDGVMSRTQKENKEPQPNTATVIQTKFDFEL